MNQVGNKTVIFLTTHLLLRSASPTVLPFQLMTTSFQLLQSNTLESSLYLCLSHTTLADPVNFTFKVCRYLTTLHHLHSDYSGPSHQYPLLDILTVSWLLAWLSPSPPRMHTLWMSQMMMIMSVIQTDQVSLAQSS